MTGSDHAFGTQGLEVGRTETEEAAVDLGIVGAERGRRLIEGGRVIRELDRHPGALGPGDGSVGGMLERDDHLPGVQVLVRQDLAEIADGTGGHVVRL